MDKKSLTQGIKEKALALGFAKVGIAPADDFDDYVEEASKRPPFYYDWMKNIPENPMAMAYPRKLMPEAKSIVCAVYDYSGIVYPPNLTKSVARAYLSRSYHPLPDSIDGARLQLLCNFLRENGCKVGEGMQVPERMACARAGIVTYGANACAYAEECGSFIILIALLIDKELEYDTPTIERRCPPDCGLCLDACPTGALVEPGKLNPRKCFLYSHVVPGSVPEDMRQLTGSRIHGCDVCQEVCPQNEKPLATANRHDTFLEFLSEEFDLEKVLLLDEQYYQRVVRPIMYNYIQDTALFRRNAAIALGNSGNESHVPALAKALDTTDPSVREHVVWALSRIGGDQAKSALLHSLRQEQSEEVKSMLAKALERMS